jgi:hypothetical protein
MKPASSIQKIQNFWQNNSNFRKPTIPDDKLPVDLYTKFDGYITNTAIQQIDLLRKELTRQNPYEEAVRADSKSHKYRMKLRNFKERTVKK